MKTITIYELLGLVKDGKAPKKIKYDNYIFEYDGIYYMTENNTYLDEYCDLSRVLNDEVEILEEEKKIPEKLEIYKEIDDEEHYANILKVSTNGECEIDEEISVIVDKVNEIIDYLKSKGE